MDTLVSVIVPAFNAAPYIKRCIDSALSQPQTGEVIVVDDGSSDNTLELINQLYGTHPKVILLQHEGNQNRGACASRNLGTENARYDWIQYLDSDDFLLEGKLERQLKIIEKTGADLLLGAYYFINLKKEKTIRSPYTHNIWLALINNQLGHTNSNLWNRRLVMKAGGWNTLWPSNQEYELLFRLLQNNPKIAVDKEPGAVNEKRSQSISTSGKNKGWQLQIELRLNAGDFIHLHAQMTPAIQQALHRFIFNKCIQLRREETLMKDWELLYARFKKAAWFKQSLLYFVVPKALIYDILGFKTADKLIKLLR